MGAPTSCDAGPPCASRTRVAVDERTGDVFVTGRVDGVLERVTP